MNNKILQKKVMKMKVILFLKNSNPIFIEKKGSFDKNIRNNDESNPILFELNSKFNEMKFLSIWNIIYRLYYYIFIKRIEVWSNKNQTEDDFVTVLPQNVSPS